LLAVTVYGAAGLTAVGVPETIPVAPSRARPGGKMGDTVHDVAASPSLEGTLGAIGVPTV
jgi:hypothetical protein